MSEGKISIDCPKCKGQVNLDFWKLKSTHKILCPNCKDFFTLNVTGDTPDKIKLKIEEEFKKAFRGLR